MPTRSLHWALPAILASLVIAVLMSIYPGMGMADPAIEAQPNASLEVRIKKGQYFMIAFADTLSKEIRPFSKGQCSADNKIGFNFFPGVKERGEMVWRHEERSQNGDSKSWSIAKLQDRTSVEKDASDIAPTLIDVSKEASIGQVQIYRIPYATSGGNTRSVLILIADATEALPKMFTISKDSEYAKFDWKTWPTSQ